MPSTRLRRGRSCSSTKGQGGGLQTTSTTSHHSDALTPVEVIARTFTWSHDSRGLFDYEAKSVYKRNYRAKMCDEGFLVTRTNCEVAMTPALPSDDEDEEEDVSSPLGSAATVAGANAALDSSGSPDGGRCSLKTKRLLRLFERDGGYWVERAAPKGDDSSSDSTEGGHKASKLWEVIRHNKGAGHRLEEGDTLKLGRFKIRVKEIVTTAEEAEERTRESEEDRGRDFSDDRASALTASTEFKNADDDDTEEVPPPAERFCRICYEAGEKENPLVAPCTCKGSMKFIHLNCLRQWMDGRLCLRPDPYGTNADAERDGHPLANSYFWRSLDCELCKTSYPSVIELPLENGRVKRIDLYEIPRPAPPYIILESKVKHHHHSRRSGQQQQQSTEAPRKGLHIMSLGNNPRGVIRVGRGHDADVRINDISVSRCHAVIRLAPGGRGKRPYFVLEDQKSKFGTLVEAPNPMRVEVTGGVLDLNPSYKSGGPKPVEGCLTLQQGRSVIQLQLRRPSLLQKMLACGGSKMSGGVPGKVSCTLAYSPSPASGGPMVLPNVTPRRTEEGRTAQDRARTDLDLPQGDQINVDSEGGDDDDRPVGPVHSLPQAVADCAMEESRDEQRSVEVTREGAVTVERMVSL